MINEIEDESADSKLYGILCLSAFDRFCSVFLIFNFLQLFGTKNFPLVFYFLEIPEVLEFLGIFWNSSLQFDFRFFNFLGKMHALLIRKLFFLCFVQKIFSSIGIEFKRIRKSGKKSGSGNSKSSRVAGKNSVRWNFKKFLAKIA